MKVMTVSLSPNPFHGPRCIAGRLRRRGAVLRETPPSFHGPREGEGRFVSRVRDFHSKC
jgi:hypothetical protein